MKRFPIAALLSAALLLAGCGRPAPTESDADKQEQERLADEKQAQILSALHEREAADDEREALLAQREQLLASPTPQPGQPAAAPAITTPPAAQPAPPSPDATYEAFYDALSQYGSWVEMPGYGYVWQPLATVQDFPWRPYTMGHWVYTDDGWTWVSSEPFGWITYHYGRWMRTHTLGWVWVPGEQWAPAWVSWRYGNNFVGWAPLPPEAVFNPATVIQQWVDDQYDLTASDYTFIPAADFGDENMADVDVPTDDNSSIFDDSNNETNIYYDTATYAIVCYGPNYDFMRSKSRRPLLPQLRLDRAGFSAGGRNGEVNSGFNIKVTAPRIVRPRAPIAPKSLRGTVVDVRLTFPPTTPPPHGAPSRAVYQPPAIPGIEHAAAQPVPAQVNPETAQPPAVALTNEPPPPALRSPEGAGAPPAPRDTRIFTEPNPNPVNPDAQPRDVQLIQQQQAERESQAEAERAAEEARNAEEIRAQEAERLEHAAEAQQAARAAQVVEAARETQATRAATQPASPPYTAAPAPAAGPGRTPQ